MSQDEVISRLHGSIQLGARDLLYRADAEGIRLVITQGLRSMKEQARLYAQGRTTPGPIVTNAPAGSSWHNFGLAIDVAPLDQWGKPHWPNDEALWTRIGEIGEAVGFEWGGRWPKPDRPHFQFRGGLTLNAARLGERPRYNVGQEPEEFPLGT